MDAVNSVFCSIAFAVLVCMLQSNFRASGTAFRWSVKALAASLLVSGFAPVLFDDTDITLRELFANASLAVVLCQVRLRQTHPELSDRLDTLWARLRDKVLRIFGAGVQ